MVGDTGILGRDFNSTIFDLPKRLAEGRPDHVVVRTLSGQKFTAAELWSRILSVATGLKELDLPLGSRIGVMLENRIEMVELYFAVPLAGHVFVPMNTGWRGRTLEHIIMDSHPAVLVTNPRRAPELDRAAAAGALEPIAFLVDQEGEEVGEGTGDNGRRFDDLRASGRLEDLRAEVARPEELIMLLYTSGTTGASKGTMLTHRSCLWMAASASSTAGYEAQDVVHSCLPLFHANALLCGLTGALLHGASFVLSPRFTVRGFWNEVTAVRATHTALLGSMIPLLTAQEPRPEERAHALKVAYCAPLPERVSAFEERFGVKCAATYGLTDANILTCRKPDDSDLQSCGVASPDWELRIVDPWGRPVALGKVGELWARPRLPYISSLGYWQNPSATVDLWRELWVNTGDLLKMDDEQRYHFVDRKKDAIRKGGENISSAEVEEAVTSHPAVAEAAAFAVPSALSEDEVMAVVTLVDGASLQPQDLFEHCVRELSFFAVPRYIEIADALPRTENHRVRKAELRQTGVTGRTWDAGPLTRRRLEGLHS